jgi:AhpD family alkylhydroperoxidase
MGLHTFIIPPLEPTAMKPESAMILEEFLRHSDTLTREIEQDAEEMLGVVPFIFRTLKERSDLFVLSALGDYLACRPGSLDAKTAELVAMTAAAAANAPDCLRVHIAAARKEGASREQIRDCLIIASVIGKTTVLARSLRILDEQQGA